MQEYIVRRLLYSIPVVFLTLLILFLIINAIPGDVVDVQTAGTTLSEEAIEEYRHDVGLDRPLFTRFFSWIGDLATGDLGTSIFTGVKVQTELERRVPVTLELGILGLAVAMIIAIPLGTISAIRANTPIDYLARLVAIGGLAVPNFVVAVLAILLLSKYLNYFPGVGYVHPWKDPVENFRLMWMPVLLVGTAQSAAVARMVRSTLLEVLHSDYIRTAWSKGLRERSIVIRHAIRNALIPVITIIGLQARSIIGGIVLIEIVFGKPGMGSWMVTSIFDRDLIPLQAIILIFALTVVVVNLIVDISYSWLDPRIRLRG